MGALFPWLQEVSMVTSSGTPFPWLQEVVSYDDCRLLAGAKCSGERVLPPIKTHSRAFCPIPCPSSHVLQTPSHKPLRRMLARKPKGGRNRRERLVSLW